MHSIEFLRRKPRITHKLAAGTVYWERYSKKSPIPAPKADLFWALFRLFSKRNAGKRVPIRIEMLDTRCWIRGVQKNLIRRSGKATGEIPHFVRNDVLLIGEAVPPARFGVRT